ncbi:MAG: bifunctional 4-hydroxy-2-oxoglutarate aldolase/2-dehydro-3-deoxy-phosphogluconate aldolase [Actinomycetota bacterium]|nr:bifunctional 4-hydroxy-2-oxoglutarate aldolase/2-dehydro-3-deoxy-phosphogluconate aldolase [Actinomycetota bacterium]
MTLDNTWFEEGFRDSPYMAILRGLGLDRTIELAELAWAAGIALVEVPVQTSGDLETLEVLAAKARSAGRCVGAGTILTTDQLEAVKHAGGSFVVTPDFDLDVVQAAADISLPILPGVATATDVARAVRAGLTWLKMFPAASLGSDWLRQIHGPFPTVRFIATGGMTPRNAPEFLRQGASGVAIGSAVSDLIVGS